MRDKNGWDLSRKQAAKYLDGFKLLYGHPTKGSEEKTPPRACETVSGPVAVSAELVCQRISEHGISPRVPRGTLKPKTRKEWREQEDIYKWTQMNQSLRGHVMMIGNEGRRNVVQSAVARRMGLLAGSSDLFIARPVEPYAGLWVEVKQNRSYSPSERRKETWVRQEAFQQRMRDAGYAAFFCYGAEDGIRRIGEYLKGTEGMKMVSRCCKAEIYAVHTNECAGYYKCRAYGMTATPLLIGGYHKDKDDDHGNDRTRTGSGAEE